MTADELRAVLKLSHPTLVAVAALIPGGKIAEEFLYNLAETPGVLEQVIAVLHLNNALPVGVTPVAK